MGSGRNARKKRVVYVINQPAFFLSHRLYLAQRAKSAGYAVSVITPDGEGVEAIQAEGLDWHEMAFDAGGMSPRRDLATLRDLIVLFRRLQPDIVHNVTLKPVLYGTLAARITGVTRVINAISGLGYLFTGDRTLKRWLGIAFYRLFMRHKDMRIILQNKEDLALFERHRLAPTAALRMIRGSGVDTVALAPGPVPAGPPMVLQTSRMVADKGVREFIEAARLVKKTRPEVRFVLAGPLYPGNPSAVSREELERAQRQGLVEWLGPRDDIPKLLSQTTIYCLPSYREGLPKALLEAAACGLPLVTTNTSGCREVVTGEDNGLLVPVGDAPALAAAIERLLSEPALARALGAKARERVLKEFSLDFVVEAQIGLYSEPPLAAKGRSGKI